MGKKNREITGKRIELTCCDKCGGDCPTIGIEADGTPFITSDATGKFQRVDFKSADQLKTVITKAQELLKQIG